jgi:glucokinase-like ROK family protein
MPATAYYQRRFRTGDQNWVRERNLSIVLRYLWDVGQPIARARLTELSGLNKSTMGSLLAQLQTWRFVRETGTVNVGPGRPGTLIDIDPAGGRIIGAEIGVDFIAVVLVDLKANIVWRKQLNTRGAAQPQAEIIALAERLFQEAIDEVHLTGQRLLGIGVGVPGLVDRATGTLLFAPNLGWRHVPLRAMWQRFGVPVFVENEANAAALGEHLIGVARHVADFIYLSAGVGLGGGLVIGGELYRGAGGYAGEVGHMTLLPDGPPCACGNRGCWETLINPAVILDQVRAAAHAGRTPILLALPEVMNDPHAIALPQVFEAAARGEEAVRYVLDEVGRYLGIGIANLLNAFNPSLVVLGGGLSLAGPYLLPRARREVETRALSAARSNVDIKLSVFQFDACVMGGVSLILLEVLNNPAAWQPA